MYTLEKPILYYSVRYHELVLCKAGMTSDGATGARDIKSNSWWLHDSLCDSGEWFPTETKVTNWQASMVLSDILRSEGHYIRSFTWFIMTFLFGGGKCRENGMFRLKRDLCG